MRLLLILVLLATTAQAGTAFFQYEMDCQGLHKACVYDYYGEDYYVMVECFELCPMSIEVPD